MKRSSPLAKIARFTLAGYAVTVTVVVALALTVGPFKDSLTLWGKIRVLESNLRESERAQKSLEEERTRLLTALKNVQADWTSQRDIIQKLRDMVKNPEADSRLEEANRVVEKLTQEKMVLIGKLNEIRQEILSRAAEVENRSSKKK